MGAQKVSAALVRGRKAMIAWIPWCTNFLTPNRILAGCAASMPYGAECYKSGGCANPAGLVGKP